MVGEPVRRRATRLFYRRTTEPTGRVTRSVRHNNTKQQGGRDDTSEQGARRDDTSEQGDCRDTSEQGGRNDASEQGDRRDKSQQGGRRDTTQQGGRGNTSLQPRKDVPQSSNCNNNRAAIIERDVTGSVITINRLKHYSFIKRKDYVDSKDIFARDASIVNETRQQKLFISDLVKFDIIQSKSLYFNYIMYNTSFFYPKY
ncbi:unnamed protein product [Rotaria sp. Silwood1]|nr:unnamed protein product [Rotaria sp. Silwood1]CAF1685998.1 unnamed protein product [Rotaria sp. Silwood1]